MLNILKSFFLDEFLSVFSSASTAEEEAQIQLNNKELDKEVHNPLAYTPGRIRSAGSMSSTGSGSGSAEDSSAGIPFRLPVPLADADSTVEVTRHGSITVLPTIPEVESEGVMVAPSPSPPPVPPPLPNMAPPMLDNALEPLVQAVTRPQRPPRPPRSLPPSGPPPPPVQSIQAVDPLTTTAHIMFELKEADEEDSIGSETSKSQIVATPSESSLESCEAARIPPVSLNNTQQPPAVSTAVRSVNIDDPDASLEDFYWPDEENK